MLYPKKKRLNQGDNTELRIHRMEQQRKINFSLQEHLRSYIKAYEHLTHIENKIVEDLQKLYTNDSSYSHLVYDLSKALKFKANIIKRETKDLRDQLEKKKRIETIFNPLKPLITQYFKNMDKKQHYQKKLPGLESKMEGKKKINGKLSNGETKKLVRNQRKLKNSTTEFQITQTEIAKETNLINLERFDQLNPLLKEFINIQMSTSFLMQDKLAPLQNYEQELREKERPEFNDKYFLNVRQESRVNMNRKLNKNYDDNDEGYVKQNIQNNYYYVNGQQQGQREEVDDVIIAENSNYRQSQYNSGYRYNAYDQKNELGESNNRNMPVEGESRRMPIQGNNSRPMPLKDNDNRPMPLGYNDNRPIPLQDNQNRPIPLEYNDNGRNPIALGN